MNIDYKLINYVTSIYKSNIGFIDTITSKKLEYPNPSWWVFSLNLKGTPINEIGGLNVLGGAGSSINYSEALIKCFGEAIERYTLINSFSINECRLLKPNEKLLNIFPKCLPDENAPKSFKRSYKYGKRLYTRAINLLNNNSEFIPVEYIYLYFNDAIERKDLLTHPISTGVAFHPNLIKAIMSGLCEVLERDAFSLFWLFKIPPKRVLFAGNTEYELEIRLKRLAESELKYFLFDITQDVKIPSILCLLISNKYPYYTVGLSCNLDPIASCCKAIDEAIAIRFANGFMTNKRKEFNLEDFSWIISLEDHSYLYANLKTTDAFDFLFGTIEVVDIKEFNKVYLLKQPTSFVQLQNIINYIHSFGLDVYYKDISTSDTKTCGNTVRVIIPQAIPLSQDHSTRWLDTDRLKGYAHKLINHYPHPFS